MALTEEAIQPLKVEIFTMYPDVKPPERATGDVAGSLPSRAVQKCPPVTAASGFGWYVYPPVDFALRWDGQHTEFSVLRENEPAQWRSLAGFYDVKLPQLAEHIAGLPKRFQPDVDIFDRDGVPFINADPRAPQLLELITGTVVRTSPGWYMLGRAVPNWPLDRGVQVLDGIVESDWYRGTVPTILRLTEPGRVVRFHRRYPLMVIQPVHRSTLAAVSDGILTTTTGISEWPEDIWAEFVDMRRKRQDPNHRSSYRQEQARRAREATGRRPAAAEA
jgi:Family of unknown function (DUF6065)